jgi:hypothetical protein
MLTRHCAPIIFKLCFADFFFVFGPPLYWRRGHPHPVSTNRKRKYAEEKMTATLKSKQTLIATVWYHLLPGASLLTPLIFHYPLPLTQLFYHIARASFPWLRRLSRLNLWPKRWPLYILQGAAISSEVGPCILWVRFRKKISTKATSILYSLRNLSTNWFSHFNPIDIIRRFLDFCNKNSFYGN